MTEELSLQASKCIIPFSLSCRRWHTQWLKYRVTPQGVSHELLARVYVLSHTHTCDIGHVPNVDETHRPQLRIFISSVSLGSAFFKPPNTPFAKSWKMAFSSPVALITRFPSLDLLPDAFGPNGK